MKVLAIAAHPDDETLGCGGMLLKHKVQGDHLSWMIATETHQPEWSAQTVKQKAKEVTQVAAAYGMKTCIKLGFKASRLDTVPQAELIRKIRQALERLRPELVYLVHGGDVHSDHRALFAAAMAAMKPLHMAQLGVRRIVCYETISSTEAAAPVGAAPFLPQIVNDITPYLERKLKIMALYKSERQADPAPRGASAIRALARVRGSTIGVEYAESFMLIRERV